jgi:eukaryotic-like serine/threonine-protein kinase
VPSPAERAGRRPRPPAFGPAEVVAAEPTTGRRWRLSEGEEIVPGRHALKRLGGGHRYEAYLAFDERLHAIVVAKLVRPHLVDDPHTLAGLAGEAEMLARLDHPVVVRGFDAVLDGPRPHLALEHLEGPRLSTLIRRYGPLPAEQLVPLGLQLCSALHYLRAEGVVHLDVKPANTIMSAPARMIDLSVALSVGEARRLDRPVGTDAYMAPEQCDPVALGPVGPAADVFGLGATFYRAATGRRPFPDADPSSDSPAERWPQLVCDPDPAPLSDLVAGPILACLARDPADRPAPAELTDALEPVLRAQPKPRLSGLKPRWR